MAAFDHFSNMHNVALKPRLLRTLIKEHVPDEKRPSSNISKIYRVISVVKTHSLLSERFTESMDQSQLENWKSAVDSWVDGILTLVSNNMPDKCWAGICLLGVTCQECSADRFLASYSGWFQKLLSFLQSPADSCFVRVASCATISDLLVRMSEFPSIKKDGSAYAGKVVQPVLKLLNDDNSEAFWESALNLLCTIITSFRSPVPRQHYNNVESAIASKLLSGGCSHNMLKKLGSCLALLPRLRGDEESWSVMMQKILVVINDQLNIAFQGFEEETKRNELVRLLVLPGKDPPPPLGGYVMGEEASNKATKKSELSLLSNVSTLMLCCCTMLTNPYPVKVNVPARILLATIERVLMVNGSLPETSLPFVTAKQQEDICSQLPFLHSYSLDMLNAITKGMGRQLLPHAASIVRLITRYFKTCLLPELRTKVYSVARNLLSSMGIGMALCLAQEVINNAYVDLNMDGNKSAGTVIGSSLHASTEALLQPSHKKRKRTSATGSLKKPDESSGLGVETTRNHALTPISLRIAALEALEALITVGGALRSEQWRSKVDSLLVDIAIDSFKEGWVNDERKMFQQNEPAATSADLQLAALRALLASFLSFSRVRHPFLAEGFELFRRGKQQIGTQLGEFCTHALLVLEVLIHPRALPLADYARQNPLGETHNFRDNYVVGQSYSTPFGFRQGCDTLESDDDLCARWLEGGEEPDVPLSEDTKHAEEPSGMCNDDDPKLLSEAAASADSEMGYVQALDIVKSPQPAESAAQIQEPVCKSVYIVKSPQPEESAGQIQEPISCKRAPLTEAFGGFVATGTVSERIASPRSVPHHPENQMESGQETLNNKDRVLASPSNSILPRMSDSHKQEGFGFKLDKGEASEDDSLPDIVDADPDSEYE